MDQSPTLTVHDAVQQLSDAGVPREKNTVQRWCKIGVLADCFKVDTTLGLQDWRIPQPSIDKRIGELKQLVVSHNVFQNTVKHHDAPQSTETHHEAPQDGELIGLRIANAAKDTVIKSLLENMERDKDRQERLTERAVKAETEKLHLEEKLKQLNAPKI